MRLKTTKSLLTMGILATVIGSFGVQSVSALSPLVDENGHTVTTDTVEKNKELMNRYRWYDQLDNGDILERNIEATTNYFGYNLQAPHAPYRIQHQLISQILRIIRNMPYRLLST